MVSANYVGENYGYDFDLFDTDGSAVRKRKEDLRFQNSPIRAVKKISLAKRGSIPLSLITVSAAIILAMANVFSMADASELSGKVNGEQDELNQVKIEQNRLKAKLDGIVTLTKVEEYAQNNLGLQKIKPEQEIRVSLNTEKPTEVINEKKTIIEIINNGWTEFSEYIGL